MNSIDTTPQEGLQPSKKEQQHMRHEERMRAQQITQRNRKVKRIVKWVLWCVIIAAFFAGVIWLSRLGVREELGAAYPDQGRSHIAVGSAHEPYNSNPPTSGPHYAQPANWGIYSSQLTDENLLHNLEHGGVWISYKGIDADTIAKIETLAKQSAYKLIVEPRAEDDAPIVLASWNRVLKLQQFDESAILAFIKSNRNRSPERDAQ